MAMPDLNRAWALFMSAPSDFIAMFVIIAVAAAGAAWWLRHFIGKERMATLQEHLRFGKEKYDTSTAEIQRLTAYAKGLENEVAILEATSSLPGSRRQLDAVIAASALVASSVTSVSTANNALGAALRAEDLTTGRAEIGRSNLKITGSSSE